MIIGEYARALLGVPLLAVPLWFLTYVCGMIVYHFIKGRPVKAIAWLFSILLYCFYVVCYAIIAVMGDPHTNRLEREMALMLLGISILVYLGQAVYWKLTQRRNKGSTRARRAKDAVCFWISVLLTVIALWGFQAQLHENRSENSYERRMKTERRIKQHFTDVGFKRYPGGITPDFFWQPEEESGGGDKATGYYETLKFKAKDDANDVLSFYKDCAEKAGLEGKIYETGTYGPMLLAIGSNGKAMLLYRQGEDTWFLRAYYHLVQPDSFEDHIKRRFELDSPR